MCGIVGLVGRQEESWLTRMSKVIEYRGPDDSGEYRDPVTGVAMAMRRLSIVDLSGGGQPMTNGDGTLSIVFNGEIYNAPELRQGLMARGHKFRTSHSDTEVLLHLYEEKKEEMPAELNGMFAFVIYDRNRRVLFGARDQVGIKPFYYLRQPDLFSFASELKCFLTLPSFSPEIDRRSLYHYMSLMYVPGEASILKDVKRLPPGHWIKYDIAGRNVTVKKYWDLEFYRTEHRTEHRTEREWTELIRDELRQAVARWSLSDVPIACSLSGGIDSSAIVGILGELGLGKIKTFSLGFTGPGEDDWNELPLAKQVAERWGTDHHELVLEPEELLEDLVRMVWHLDEPYGGGLPSWYVFKFMSEEVKVGFSGTGCDELFGSYGKFRPLESSLMAQMGLAYRRRFDGRARWDTGRWGPLNRFFDPLGSCFFETSYYFSDAQKKEHVFSISTDGSFDTRDILSDYFDQSGTDDLRDGLTYVDFKTQLPEEFLLMTDRFSMAHSLEARVPFLDRQFLELVLRISSGVRTQPLNLKYLLKKSVADILPPDVLTASKRGFVIPIKLWLRDQLKPLAKSLLAPERLRRQGLYNPEFFDRFVLPHVEGRADYTQQVWAALMFQLWHMVFIEQEQVELPSSTWRDMVV